MIEPIKNNIIWKLRSEMIGRRKKRFKKKGKRVQKKIKNWKKKNYFKGKKTQNQINTTQYALRKIKYKTEKSFIDNKIKEKIF